MLIGLVQKQGSGKLVLARMWLHTSRGTWSQLFLALVSPSAPGAGGQILPTLPVLNSYVLHILLLSLWEVDFWSFVF